MKKINIILILAIFILASCNRKNDTMKNDNPFLKTWDTPFEVPPFNQIQTQHYLPAFEEGIKQQKAEIESIINNSEEPTFANTIESMEYSGAILNRVSAVFFNLLECMNSPEMEKLADTIFPLVTKHNDEISLNSELFKRIKTVYKQKETLNLNGEQARLLEETYKGFVRNGANISEEQKERFKEINIRLSELTQKFGNNVLKATNDYKMVVDDPAKLEGLSEGEMAAAAEDANQDEATKGKWVFTIHLPSMEPFLQHSKNRELRHELWMAYSNRCTSGETNNTQIINEIQQLRLEKANILGFPTWADYVLDDCMAKNPKNVNMLLMQVWYPALKRAKEEAAEYQKMIKTEKQDFKLEPWDWRYYCEKLRKEKYNLDEDEIRPYLSLDAVKEGIFMCCDSLYGLHFVKNEQLPVYHPEVEVYEVQDNGKTIAILYMDYFPRKSKRSGAWMTEFQQQFVNQQGKNVIPVISLVMNFTKAVGNQPALLNFDQTETFFHEFGHGLHGMLSKCHYRNLSGTSVSRDFVELPSQFFEHWARTPQVLKQFAKHYQTGEHIPDALINKIETASTYGQGFINTELLAASLLDMAYHTIFTKTDIKLPDFENDYLNSIGLIPEIISRYKSPYFQHIFSGGYSAGYYAYTWAAVLDNDAFEPFKEKGVFNKEIANSFRHNILERGNTEDPMTLYVRFRGQGPSIEPLLKNRGLK